MSKSLDQFNLTVICQSHNKKCNLLCCFSGCRERALCSECFSSHDYSHLSSIVPLDSKSHFTPNLFSKQILEIESEILSQEAKVKNLQDDLYKEIDKFLQDIEESFRKKIASFRRQILKFVEDFNGYYKKIFKNFLNVLKKEYLEIDKIIKLDKDYFSSERVHHLLIKQNELETNIIPSLRKQTLIIIREINNRFIKLQKNDVFLLIDEKFKKIFQIQSFISCSKHNQLLPTESNFQTKEIKKLFSNSSKKENNNTNAFTFSDRFPLPKYEEIPNTKLPFVYSNRIPQHFEICLHKDIIKNLVTLKENHIFASVSGDNIIKIWDLKNEKSKGEMQVYHKETHAVCFIPDRNFMITAGKDLNIRVWDMENYKCKKIINEAHTKTIYCLLYLKDGATLVSGAGDGLVKMWDFITGKLLNVFSGHENSVKCLFFLKDLYCFSSGGSDSCIKIWDITQNKLKYNLNGHEGTVNCFEYLQNKHWLFSGGQEKKIKIWELFEDGFIKTLEGHNDGVFCLKLVNYEHNLISGGGDFLIKIWDFLNEKCVLVLKAHQEIVSSIIAIRNDIFVSGGWDHKVIFWKL